jgi:prepilin-type N-terminal cleavage/methylation domain-containing protein
MMARGVSKNRGFTIVEALTVVAIVGVLAGLSAIALNRLKRRGNFSSATGDFISGLRTCRAEAYARGDNTVMIIDAAHGQWWAIEDVAGNFSLATNTWNPIVAPARLLSSGTLPSGVIFGPANGWGTALPAPYSGIPTGFVTLPDGGSANITTDGGSAAPNFNYCSFCDPSTKLGAITFLPSGGALFNSGPLTIGQQIAIEDIGGLPDGGGAYDIYDFAIVAATGSVGIYSVKDGTLK